MKVSRKKLSPEAVDILKSHDWPGNLDELKAIMRTALSNCRGNYIRAEHLPELHRVPASKLASIGNLFKFKAFHLH